jgi:hypothetical protein
MRRHDSVFMNGQSTRTARFSSFSIIAVICAFLSFATGPLLSLIFAGLAIVCGFLGVVLSFSSTTRGGLLSIISVLAGLGGIVVALFKLVRLLVG